MIELHWSWKNQSCWGYEPLNKACLQNQQRICKIGNSQSTETTIFSLSQKCCCCCSTYLFCVTEGALCWRATDLIVINSFNPFKFDDVANIPDATFNLNYKTRITWSIKDSVTFLFNQPNHCLCNLNRRVWDNYKNLP